jgi:calcineurin-like phosphoesterase family protein
VTQVWHMSDEHFGHKAIIPYEKRPFASAEEMDAFIVEQHNKVVRKNDLVFHYGDVTCDRLEPLENVAKLNGRHILIAGNHDGVHPLHRDWYKYMPRYIEAGFEAIAPWARRRVAEFEFLQSHFPYYGDHTDNVRFDQYRLKDQGLPIVHGHVHSLYTEKDRQLNVGVDVWNFTPVSEDQVIDWIRSLNG